MNFFEHQKKVQRNTVRLYVLFVVTVFLMAVALYILSVVMILMSHVFFGTGTVLGFSSVQNFWNPLLFLFVVFCTFMFFLAVSLFEIDKLKKGGGVALAMQLGANRLKEAKDPLERQLQNVIAEISIASGLAVPATFLLEQEGINAFVAGYASKDRAIVVTRGAIEMLSRDELQAVIAHEFSHVLHGDTLLKMKMLGLLYGVIGISDFNQRVFLKAALPFLQTEWFSSVKGQSILACAFIAFILSLVMGHGLWLPLTLDMTLFVMGVVLIYIVAVAYICLLGVFSIVAADFIRATMSRQQEYLADASAVQLTKNPEALSAALQVIGGYKASSRLKGQHIEQCSHLFFSDALKSWWRSDLWSSHPPLLARIQRIQPRFRSFSFQQVDEVAVRTTNQEQAMTFFVDEANVKRQGKNVMLSVDSVMQSVGETSADHLQHAKTLLAEVPRAIRDHLSASYMTKALAYFLLLDSDEAILSKQLACLEAGETKKVMSELILVRRAFPKVAMSLRLPLLDLLTPHLLAMEETEKKQFLALLQKLIAANCDVSLFEYLVYQHMLHHLDMKGKKSNVKSLKSKEVVIACSDVLKAVSVLGKHQDVETIYQQAMQMVFPKIQFAGREVMLVKQLAAALNRLNVCPMPLKQKLLTSVVFCVLSDGEVSVEELETLRVIAMMLGCPMPLLSVSGESQ